MQLKLDELIRVTKDTRSTLADLEDASEEELADFERQFQALRDACSRPAPKRRRASMIESAA